MSEYPRNSFSSRAIRNPIPPIVLFLVLTVAGLIAYMKLPVNNMTALVVPMVSVHISQPGATVTEMETQITRKVESALAGLQVLLPIISPYGSFQKQYCGITALTQNPYKARPRTKHLEHWTILHLLAKTASHSKLWSRPSRIVFGNELPGIDKTNLRP